MERKDVFSWVKEVYGTEPDYPWNDCNAVLRHKGNNKWYGVVLEKAWADWRRDCRCHKCEMRSRSHWFPQRTIRFFPAYHMNKENWISILLDGSVP